MFAVLGALATWAMFSLVPGDSFASPFFWIGFGVTFCIGAFLIQSLKPSRTRIGAGIFGLWEFTLIIASNTYSGALFLAAGFPGFFAGIFAIFFYYAIARTKTTYCPRCGTKTLMERRNGEWYCLNGKHEVH